ncbi:MAG: ribulose phosphate epimerase [Deltaproteobacteria bacterium]|nr:MAG: ribulose phosphate epimerase [Deltaproteobacteria bacterium]
MDPDGGMGTMECDVWTQDCPDGEKCMPWANDGGNSWNATKCSPIDPNPKQPGDTCTVEGNGVSGVDDCAKASMCWDVDPETNMGTCVPFCTGSPDMPMCENPNDSCLIANDGVLILCLPGCDPLLQDCPDGNVCIPNTSGDGFACVLDASGGMGTAGTPCEFANVCNPGLLCLNAEFVPGCMGSQGCCGPFCDLTDPNASSMCANAYTTPGADCVPFFEMGMEPPGQEDVGICIIPQ